MVTFISKGYSEMLITLYFAHTVSVRLEYPRRRSVVLLKVIVILLSSDTVPIQKQTMHGMLSTFEGTGFCLTAHGEQDTETEKPSNLYANITNFSSLPIPNILFILIFLTRQET